MQAFNPREMPLTKYLFYTGKGGVGKTSVACATAVTLADNGKKVLLISTDPASNLQDVFATELDGKGKPIKEVPNLVVTNLDPLQAAAEYRESVVAPYRGKLPDSVIANMEEQLSGSCTVEIAAFNEFSHFITSGTTEKEYDYIIFDTAPTGHTLRMLQLPSAWSNFISESTHGASCLGQLAGLEDKKDMYKKAVETLSDGSKTTLLLVSRPEVTPLKEAARASQELTQLGVNNQILIINGELRKHDDTISAKLYQKQQAALAGLPEGLKTITRYSIPLRAYTIAGIENIRAFLTKDYAVVKNENVRAQSIPRLQDVVDELAATEKKSDFHDGQGRRGQNNGCRSHCLRLISQGGKSTSCYYRPRSSP
ncbi:Arsenical pump-driving ATPase (fragment) [uncultured Sporomusa sp.]|uniref:Arsenical pump-driving ATPase n=1 Tax=uncultured Sporomusa sp. TaxID=307249 RepID=A0A212LNY4_9FIRM